MKGGGHDPHLQEPGPKNTIMTESMQESGHRQSTYFLVCGLDSADAITRYRGRREKKKEKQFSVGLVLGAGGFSSSYPPPPPTLPLLVEGGGGG